MLFYKTLQFCTYINGVFSNSFPNKSNMLHNSTSGGLCFANELGGAYSTNCPPCKFRATLTSQQPLLTDLKMNTHLLYLFISISQEKGLRVLFPRRSSAPASRLETHQKESLGTALQITFQTTRGCSVGVWGHTMGCREEHSGEQLGRERRGSSEQQGEHQLAMCSCNKG